MKEHVVLSPMTPFQEGLFSMVATECSTRPRLAITMGDVNGVGPEILAKALTRRWIWDLCRPIVIGCGSALDLQRKFVCDMPRPQRVANPADATFDPRTIPVYHAGQDDPPFRPGALDADAGRAAVEWIRAAVRLTQTAWWTGSLPVRLIKKESNWPVVRRPATPKSSPK